MILGILKKFLKKFIFSRTLTSARRSCMMNNTVVERCLADRKKSAKTSQGIFSNILFVLYILVTRICVQYTLYSGMECNRGAERQDAEKNRLPGRPVSLPAACYALAVGERTR